LLEITGEDTACEFPKQGRFGKGSKDGFTPSRRSIYTVPAEQAIDDPECTTFNILPNTQKSNPEE